MNKTKTQHRKEVKKYLELLFKQVMTNIDNRKHFTLTPSAEVTGAMIALEINRLRLKHDIKPD